MGVIHDVTLKTSRPFGPETMSYMHAVDRDGKTLLIGATGAQLRFASYGFWSVRLAP